MNISPTLRSVQLTLAFVEYASLRWGTHARRETTEGVKALPLKLLEGYDRHISSKMLLFYGMEAWDRPLDWGDSPRGFTGLHGAAYFGCAEIIVALLKMKEWDVRATNFHGNIALIWVARRGMRGCEGTARTERRRSQHC